MKILGEEGSLLNEEVLLHLAKEIGSKKTEFERHDKAVKAVASASREANSSITSPSRLREARGSHPDILSGRQQESYIRTLRSQYGVLKYLRDTVCGAEDGEEEGDEDGEACEDMAAAVRVNVDAWWAEKGKETITPLLEWLETAASGRKKSSSGKKKNEESSEEGLNDEEEGLKASANEDVPPKEDVTPMKPIDDTVLQEHKKLLRKKVKTLLAHLTECCASDDATAASVAANSATSSSAKASSSSSSKARPVALSSKAPPLAEHEVVSLLNLRPTGYEVEIFLDNWEAIVSAGGSPGEEEECGSCFDFRKIESCLTCMGGVGASVGSVHSSPASSDTKYQGLARTPRRTLSSDKKIVYYSSLRQFFAIGNGHRH